MLLGFAEGGRGDPDMVPGPGLFAPPERIDARPFSGVEAARSIQDTAIEVLQARGEPARYERLLGEILVGLDRSGQLRRLVQAESRSRGGSLDRPLPPPDRAHGDTTTDRDPGTPEPFRAPPSPRAPGSHARGFAPPTSVSSPRAPGRRRDA